MKGDTARKVSQRQASGVQTKKGQDVAPAKTETATSTRRDGARHDDNGVVDVLCRERALVSDGTGLGWRLSYGYARRRADRLA